MDRGTTLYTKKAYLHEISVCKILFCKQKSKPQKKIENFRKGEQKAERRKREKIL